MSTLYTCYSPKGEKFELSKANYMDVTSHHGFTTTPPSDLEFDESEMENDDELEQDEIQSDDEQHDAEETVSETSDESEEEEVIVEDASDEDEEEEEEEEVVVEQEALAFESATDAKAYLRSKGVQFDGRLSLADLTDLANGKAA